MATQAFRVGVLALATWLLAVGLPAWGQTPATATDEVEEFYSGADDETKELLRASLRPAAPTEPEQVAPVPVPENAFRQVPAGELAARRLEWLRLVEGDRDQAIENLGAARCVQAVPALLRLATDRGPGDPRTRWLAVRALGRIGDERAIPELIHLVTYPEESTRLWARASLLRLTGQWFGGDREAWGRWWNESGGEPRYVPEDRYPGSRPRSVRTGGRMLVDDIAADAGPGNGGRSWGPEQATGAPDTPRAGDLTTAWASRTPDSAPEWLQLEYERAVPVAAVRVYETYNPGAVCRATAVADDGAEVTLWEGQDTTTQAPGVLQVGAATPVTARRIKVYLDSPKVRGWNEIDAVELVGKDGSRQWARAATASSTYAEQAAQGRR